MRSENNNYKKLDTEPVFVVIGLQDEVFEVEKCGINSLFMSNFETRKLK